MSVLNKPFLSHDPSGRLWIVARMLPAAEGSTLLAFVPDVETHALSKQSYNSALHRSSDGHVDHLRDVLEAKPTR